MLEISFFLFFLLSSMDGLITLEDDDHFFSARTDSLYEAYRAHETHRILIYYLTKYTIFIIETTIPYIKIKMSRQFTILHQQMIFYQVLYISLLIFCLSLSES